MFACRDVVFPFWKRQKIYKSKQSFFKSYNDVPI